MDSDVKEWLEREYSQFERDNFRYCRVWRSPEHTLKGTQLHALFERFARTFPDHPSDINTVFYLTESLRVTPVHHKVAIWCNHFEHWALEDLRNLVSFIDEALRLLSTSDESGGVEILDNNGERLVLVFYSPRESIVELLKNRGKLVSAAE